MPGGITIVVAQKTRADPHRPAEEDHFSPGMPAFPPGELWRRGMPVL